MPWQRRKVKECKAKYELAIEMLQWALSVGFPKCTVLADSWFGTGPFIKGLKLLELSYVIEVKKSYKVRVPSKSTKLTPTGKVAKRQYDLISIPEYYKGITSINKYGLAPDQDSGKSEKVLYHTKAATIRLNSISGKHRIIESIDPARATTKYLLTDHLTWEAGKIISEYTNRWVIEEFFRNAKQLTDMEGATIRSEQGITTALSLVSWIDSLLHFESYKQSIADKLTKGSLTIPSIVRRAQYDNLKALLNRAINEEDYIHRWLSVEENNIIRIRKQKKELVTIEEVETYSKGKAA
jgi:hypothetical protein